MNEWVGDAIMSVLMVIVLGIILIAFG